MLPRREYNFFAGEHGLCFTSYHCPALRDAEGAHGVEATPLSKIGLRLRGATVGDTTFGPVAEGARRQDVRNTEVNERERAEKIPIFARLRVGR